MGNKLRIINFIFTSLIMILFTPIFIIMLLFDAFVELINDFQ